MVSRSGDSSDPLVGREDFCMNGFLVPVGMANFNIRAARAVVEIDSLRLEPSVNVDDFAWELSEARRLFLSLEQIGSILSVEPPLVSRLREAIFKGERALARIESRDFRSIECLPAWRKVPEPPVQIEVVPVRVEVEPPVVSVGCDESIFPREDSSQISIVCTVESSADEVVSNPVCPVSVQFEGRDEQVASVVVCMTVGHEWSRSDSEDKFVPQPMSFHLVNDNQTWEPPWFKLFSGSRAGLIFALSDENRIWKPPWMYVVFLLLIKILSLFVF